MLMRLGFSLPNNQGTERVADLVDLAREAEQLGYHSVWVSEHLWHSSYVARRLGSRPYHEPLTVLTAAAPATSSIRLGTSVLVLPWHHPVRLAKTIASLDDLADGRIDLGVGVAVTEDEFANLGIDFATAPMMRSRRSKHCGLRRFPSMPVSSMRSPVCASSRNRGRSPIRRY